MKNYLSEFLALQKIRKIDKQEIKNKNDKQRASYIQDK
jgi:hypothetical protein